MKRIGLISVILFECVQAIIGQGYDRYGKFVESGSPYQYRSGYCEQSLHQYFNEGTCPTGKEANHWIFADDSIHLEWNGTNFIEQTPAGAGTFEASAIANDANGQLLFYTNGRKVYNRQNQVMPNGNLMIDASSSTQKITVPLPGSDSLWYLFIPMSSDIVSPLGDTTTKLLMSLVDMSLDGGNGDVVIKNQNILQPTTEKVVATHHCNGVDWWIVGHEAGSNRFFSWLLSKNSLQSPVQSNLGIVKPNDRSTKAGELQFSPDGLKLAMITGPSYFKSKDTSWTVEIFDFDPLTGIISNNNLLGEFPGEHPHSETYGLEFSPNNHFLYVARAAWYDTLMQFDVTLPTIQEIRNSRKDVFIAQDPTEDALFALLTGPDSKIYVANYLEPYLGVIENPNESGENVIYNNKGLVFNRGVSSLGLPNFPNGIYHPGKPWIKGPKSICDTIQEAQYYISGNCRYQDYEWHVTGNSSIVRMLGDTIWLHPIHPGQEQLTVQKFSACGITTDTIYITIDSCLSGYNPCKFNFTWGEVDTVICKGEDAWFSYFSQADHAFIELNHDGILRPVSGSLLSIPQPDKDVLISLHLNSDLGCDTIIEIWVHINPPIEFNITTLDTLVCFGDSALLDITTSPSNLIEIFSKDLNWVISNPSLPLHFGPVIQDSSLYIRIRNTSVDCDSIYQWNIHLDPGSVVSSDTLIGCKGDSIEVEGMWYHQDADLMQTYIRPGCDSLHSTILRFKNPPEIEVHVQAPCPESAGSVMMSTLNDPILIYSINGGTVQTSPQFSELTPGFYNLSAFNAFGCKTDTTIQLPFPSDFHSITTVVTPTTCQEDNGSIIFHPLLTTFLFQWMDHAPSYDSVFSGLSNGRYLFQIQDTLGCVDTVIIDIPSKDISTYTFEITPAQCGKTNGAIDLYPARNINEVTIDETPLKTFRQHIGELGAGDLHLHIRDTNDCLVDTIIHIPASCDLFIPNVFSPNGDGINDIFGLIPLINFNFWELNIFDRSGNLIFTSFDPLKGWSGETKNQPAQSGVYAWTLEFQISGIGEFTFKKGDITLVR